MTRPMLRLLALAGLSFALSPAAAAQEGAISYDSRAACEQQGRLSSEQCGHAFGNGRAEFEEKAPRYRARHDCQRQHRQCSAQLVGGSGFSGLASSAAIFVPSFRGVTITLHGGKAEVLPKLAAGSSRFRPRGIDAADTRIDGRVAVVPDSRSGRSRRFGSDPQSSGPYVRRGDRDDTVRMKLEVKDPNDPTATGLFVDKNGVEWYRPARRR